MFFSFRWFRLNGRPGQGENQSLRTRKEELEREKEENGELSNDSPIGSDTDTNYID